MTRLLPLGRHRPIHLRRYRDPLRYRINDGTGQPLGSWGGPAGLLYL